MPAQRSVRGPAHTRGGAPGGAGWRGGSADGGPRRLATIVRAVRWPDANGGRVTPVPAQRIRPKALDLAARPAAGAISPGGVHPWEVGIGARTPVRGIAAGPPAGRTGCSRSKERTRRGAPAVSRSQRCRCACPLPRPGADGPSARISTRPPAEGVAPGMPRPHRAEGPRIGGAEVADGTEANQVPPGGRRW